MNSPLAFSGLITLGFITFMVWGSFLGAAYFRLLKRYDLDNPQYLSLWLGRSSCRNCDKKLSWYQLIPVFSWLFLRGKCGFCKEKVSFFYPLIELFSGLLFLAHVSLGLTLWEAGFLTLVATTLLIMSLIDYETFILPDNLQLMLFIFWFMALLSPDFTPHIFETFVEGLGGCLFTIGLLLGLRALFFLFRKVEALGLGDVKLAAIAGLWIGVFDMPWMLLIASVFTLLVVLITQTLKKNVTLVTRLPFGPGLALGFYVTFLLKMSIK